MGLQKIEFLNKKGNFVRDCPGTKNHICCGYKNIDLIEGCILSCSYCILKHYIKEEKIKINLNVKSIIAEVDDLIEKEHNHILRFGTGELSDSLALDRRYNLNRPLIEYFGEKKKAIFELKSKWAQIEHLKPFLNPYTVISFSLAPQNIIDKEEKRTSPLYKRLKALKKAQDSGCFVGLHLDPIIIYEGFEHDYYWLIEDIGRILDLDRIIWISLGLLRFPAKMMDVFIQEKRKNLLFSEFTKGEDGKYRYIKGERIRVYKTLYDLLKNKNENLFIYLCMERKDVWKESFGININKSEDLITLFDKRIKYLYGGMI
ncbi:MAG TPA: radical SAM protein [Syntrophorhabdaceae bacterium]|nr:radical SAM protein [Syntrophorhabdaceae bacterium]HPU30684.1 radical SAM protein [Syntrophorhabdaceae bacterium]